ncbi:MAG: hypothetical protein HC842_01855 [Cytophagales bacterium]|nr:hypothetical protein [Cytophagales bacterium]
MTTRIFTYVTLVISLGLAYYLFHVINSKLEQDRQIVKTEQEVIERLKLIRQLEIAYLSRKGKYTDNWDSLRNFAQNDYIYLINKEEKVFTLAYGADSSVFVIDTVGKISVRDSIINPKQYPDLSLAELELAPGSGKPFAVKVDKIQKGGVLVDVIEVKDVAPVNPIRKEDNEIKNRKPLRFGSLEEVSTSGNWE